MRACEEEYIILCIILREYIHGPVVRKHGNITVKKAIPD